MKTYRLADGSIVSQDELDRLRSEDFKFQVLCEAKGNRSMYSMLRNRDILKVEEIVDAENEELELILNLTSGLS